MPAFDPAALELHVLEVPELAEWLNSEPAKPFPFTGTWSELKDRPWILFHSSGTTGLPKVIPYTHEMMASVDAARLLEDTKDSTMFDEFRGGRWFSSVPMSHCASLVVALQLTVFLDVVLVLGPSTVPLTDQQLVDIVDLAGLDGIFAVPGDYERLAKDTRGWQSLVKIKKINYVGAQLRQTLGDSLEASGARVFCCMGTTEAGYYHLKSRKDASWEWVTPVSAMGATFERYIGDDEMYELIFTRESGLERYQQVFKVYPDLSEYHTKDLFVKHPTKSDAWKPVGRTDDFMKLLHGHGLYTARIEERLLEATHGTFQYILVGGQGHDKPCVLAMPKSHEITDSSARRQLLAQLWAAVVAVNNTSSPWAQVPRHLLMLMDPQRPVKLTSKGTVSRMETLSLYEADISLLYSPQGPSE
ncbi:MAG: hypothetical protein M1828_001944 [Chrysothrix sp. TS-e1954]|nr:MAG: hypothetical protein M1828_001944 [Chrysothrix sp. TS-e1954]